MPTSTSPSAAARFRPDIQGLRAVAVVAVVANHAGLSRLSGGYVGVDVFFVISGFLITSHLLRSLMTTGRIDFGAFYGRRIRRLLPASFVVMALSIVGAFVWIPPLLREQALKDAVSTALYLPNYAFAQQGADYLSESSPSLFQHYWSLGVEEQFYLLWPIVLALLFAAVARRRGGLLLALGAIVLASLAVCVLLTDESQPWAFFSLWTRAWELGLGGIVAVLLARGEPVLSPRVAAVAGWAGLGGIVFACTAYSSGTAYPGTAAVLPVVATATVILAGATPTRFGATTLLATRPFLFLGRVSYPLYLVHWPMLVLTQAAVGYYTPLPQWATVLLAVVAVPVAWLLHRFVEEPARRAHWLTRARPRRSLLGAAIGSAAIVIAAAVGIAETGALPLNAGRAAVQTAPSDPPRATGFVPTNMTPTLQKADGDNPSIYATGCVVGTAQTEAHACSFGTASHGRIVLFGDSHAAQWFPALEEISQRRGFQLDTQTKSGCASVAVEVLRKGVPYASCDAWRANVIAQVRADPPALVVLADYTNADFAHSDKKTEQWRRGLETTIAQLSPVTKVVVIADTPDLRNSPTVCLSAHLGSADDCGRPASLALKSPGRAAEVQATAATTATLIDLTGYFCSSGWCPAVIGDTLAYRDSHHISATFSRKLGGALGEQLVPLMPGTGR
jgi:peptidoglycan/LPS O-acetylase OafA/YrhL